MRQIKQLRDENRRLKQLVAELALDGRCVGRAAKKVVRPSRRRPLVPFLEQSYRMSQRRA